MACTSTVDVSSVDSSAVSRSAVATGSSSRSRAPPNTPQVPPPIVSFARCCSRIFPSWWTSNPAAPNLPQWVWPSAHRTNRSPDRTVMDSQSLC